jgi:uncharacterized protein YraI
MGLVLLFIGFVAVPMALKSSAPQDVAFAQDGEGCEVIIEDALQTMGSACAEIGRNEACYGHLNVAATFQQEEASFPFDQSGDLVGLIDLQALFTEAVNISAGTWGVALMQVQADLPDDSDSSMSYVLFGDTNLTINSEEMDELATCNVSNVTGENVNVRRGPTGSRDITGVFPFDEEALATGRDASGEWLRIERNNSSGWIGASGMQLDCDVDTLSVVDETDSFVASASPMQVVSLETANNSTCDAAPDGLMVRSPEGTRSRIVVNGVEMIFSSAAFITAQDDVLTVDGLEGDIEVISFGESQNVTPGTFTQIDLNEDMQADGPPSDPEPYDPTNPIYGVFTLTNGILNEFILGLGGGTVVTDAPVIEPPDGVVISIGTPVIIDTGDPDTSVSFFNAPPPADCTPVAPTGNQVFNGNSGVVAGGPSYDACYGFTYYLLQMDDGSLGWIVTENFSVTG